MMQNRPNKLQLFCYGFLALPLAFAGLPLYIHAPDFYTRELGVNIGLMGVVLLLVRLIDAVQDPLIGYFSDKYAGKRYQIMLSGCGMLAVGMAALFWGPPSTQITFFWLAAALFIATTGFSIVVINLNMIGGFWYQDRHQRTRIAAWREALGLLGLLIAALLPTLLQLKLSVADAFLSLIFIFSVLLFLGFFLFSFFFNALPANHQLNVVHSRNPFAFWRLLLGEHRRFFLVCLLSHLAAALPAVMVLFFIRDYLAAEQFTGVFLFIYFIAGAAFMQVWVKLAAKAGKQQAWLISMLLAVITFIWAYSLSPDSVVAYVLICLLSGIALGADLALPASILADRVSISQNESEASQFYALLAFIPKFAIAMCSGIAFIILDHLGFKTDSVNNSQAVQGIVFLYALVPCLIKLAAAYALWSMVKQEGDYNEKNTTHRELNNA